MPRPRLILVVSFAAVALLVSLAGIAGATDNRATPKRLTSSTSPERDRTAPYGYTTSGELQLPDRMSMCPPGHGGDDRQQRDDHGGGGDDDDYCAKFTKKQACTGTVRVTYVQNNSTVKQVDDTLNSKCEYSVSVSLTSSQVNPGNIKVKARFLGNTFLKPIDAPDDTVRAG
jgi:hypothetical protein